METKIEKPAALLPDDILDRARKLGSALLADGMKGLGVLNDGSMLSTINPVDVSMKVVGTAFTIESADGDNLPIHLGMKLLQDGYVMVIDGKGYEGKAYFGDLMARQSMAMGAVAMVVDGCVRDREELIELGLPVYTRGYMQRGPGKKSPGRINCPIMCGGVHVQPGDLVIGDCDGVTVVPKEKIEEALAAAEKKDAYEHERRATIAAYLKAKAKGETPASLSPAWVDEQLAELGIQL